VVLKPELILNGTPANDLALSSLCMNAGFMLLPEPGASGESNSESVKCFNCIV
jgi:hypothetical protein